MYDNGTQQSWIYWDKETRPDSHILHIYLLPVPSPVSTSNIMPNHKVPREGERGNDDRFSTRSIRRVAILQLDVCLILCNLLGWSALEMMADEYVVVRSVEAG